MSEATKIQWCDSTVNFWSGCTKVSQGCTHCYAETRDKRHMIEPVNHWGKGAPRLKHTGTVKQALALNRRPWICDGCGNTSTHHDTNICWKETNGSKCMCRTAHRRRIFSNSISDRLDEEVPIEWLAEMLDTIRQCQEVIWILCTKRPKLWSSRIESVLKWLEKNDCKWPINDCSSLALRNWLADWFVLRHMPKHIILLTSVENQETADKRIPELLKIPATARGLSLEPLLSGIDLTRIGKWKNENLSCLEEIVGHVNRPKIDWLIIGGESGAGARPCNVEWIRNIVEQSKEAGVATFVKQLGSKPILSVGRTGRLEMIKDKKGGNMAEWPADLQVQEWPVIS